MLLLTASLMLHFPCFWRSRAFEPQRKFPRRTLRSGLIRLGNSDFQVSVHLVRSACESVLRYFKKLVFHEFRVKRFAENVDVLNESQKVLSGVLALVEKLEPEVVENEGQQVDALIGSVAFFNQLGEKADDVLVVSEL